jgi:hypothetical protein
VRANAKRRWAIGAAAGVALAAAALAWSMRIPGGARMTDPQAQFHHLWHVLQTENLGLEQYKAYDDELVRLLADHPELDAFFLDRYVTHHADEGELGSALGTLAYLGRRRPFDHTPLLALLHRDDVSIGYKCDALFCVTQLADHLDERVLLDLMDTLPGYLGLSAVCKVIDALDSIRDRAKAARLLRRCLKATDTTDEMTFRFLLGNFVARTNGNEDIFEAALREPRPPHEVVILAVSLMKKTLPVFSPYRVLADEAAARSQLADDYYNYYVGRYVARDD